MTSVSAPLYALNAGQVGAHSLARIDLARMRIAAALQENLLPRVIGPATFRPGTAYLDRTLSDQVPTLIPFVFNAATKALIVAVNAGLQIMVDDAFVVRPSVSATITNGGFDTDLTGWTDSDESGAVSAWATGGYMSLLGTGANYAIREQQVTVTETGVEHALRIVVARGPVRLLVGSSAGLDDYIATTSLREGTHSLAFTPAGNFHIRLAANAATARLVDSIAVEGTGRVTLPTPWGSSHRQVRYAQSGDILYVALDGTQQRQLERRSQRSWSIVKYYTADGPFRPPNTDNATLTPSAVSGSITLTASHNVFRSGHVGALFRLTHSGQTQTANLSGEDQFTAAVRVTGLKDGGQRIVTVIITGTWTGTLTLQRSFDEIGSWTDVKTYSSNTTDNHNDGLDNQIVFYRVGFKTGDYGSGTAAATITHSGSSQKGIVRITAVASATSASADVITGIGKAEATTRWEEGTWSDYRGFPSAVVFYDGRLWWGWRDTVYGSVSDDYVSYSDEVIGDSGPVIRSVATGPFEGILWMLSLQRLLVGTASQEVSIRASSFDEPLTPTAFTARDFSSRGCADLDAVKVDSRGIFVQRNGKRVYEVLFSLDDQDYSSRDITRLNPEICLAGVENIAVQRQPDTRVWFMLGQNDPTCAVLVYEPSDEVVAWSLVRTTSGDAYQAVAVLPGQDEDEVYFAVRRATSAGNIMAIEKLAKLSEVVGGTLSKNLDCHVVYTGSATTSIPVAHLDGRSVKVWRNGVPDTASYTVASGVITLAEAATNVVAGLPYTGKFQSTKLAYGGTMGTAMGKRKRVDHISLVMADVGWKGVRIGRNASNLTGLSATRGNGPALSATAILSSYDYDATPFAGEWDSDPRIYFEISSPYPATFMGIVIDETTSEKKKQPGGARQGGGEDS